MIEYIQEKGIDTEVKSMEELGFYIEEGRPFRGRKLERMKAFLKAQDLDWEEGLQYSVMIYTKEGAAAGCGSRQGNVLKDIGVAPEFQGEGLMAKLVSLLMKDAWEAGIRHLFVFTKPKNQSYFQEMGFWPIMDTGAMLLLENKKEGIQKYLKEEAAPFADRFALQTGAIVMNANPFTKGHRYLIQQAARACEILHVFVLAEDASEFPAGVRLELVKRGCADLENVYVHGSSDYLISYGTFPDYFLKDKAKASKEAVLLDLKIFGKYYKEAFHIDCRYVGEEPFSEITRVYNQEMKKILPGYGIQVIEIPRCRNGEQVISATYVRKKFLEGDWEGLRELVPDSTYEYLDSQEGKKLREKLQQGDI